jgi:hypothetical protein
MRALRRSAIFISRRSPVGILRPSCSPGPGTIRSEEVAEPLAELKASGDYDRILAETVS